MSEHSKGPLTLGSGSRARIAVLVIVGGCFGGGTDGDGASANGSSASIAACRDFCVAQDEQLGGMCRPTFSECETSCAEGAAEVSSGCEGAYEAVWRCSAQATFQCFMGFAVYSAPCDAQWETFNQCQDPSLSIPATPTPDAMQACRDVVTAYCDFENRCSNPLSPAECENDLSDQGFDCERAAAVGSRLDECLAAARSQACTEVGLPTSCGGVIEVAPVPPGRFHACFDAPSFGTCDAYCRSMGKQCNPCEEASGFAGLQWGNAGTCPDEDAQSVIVVLDCDDSFVYDEARCCCG